MIPNARYGVFLGILAVVAVLVVALLSFIGFVHSLDPQEPEDPAPAQGIVVLTGGADRLADGLRLLEAGRAQRLLISGVNRGTSLSELKRLLPMHAEALTCCVDPGYDAGNTRGNAQETALWALRHGYTRLIIVTAAYHVPRVRLEFGHRMPGLSLAYYPVVPDQAGLKTWWREPALARILALEYAKFRLAQLRVRLGLWRDPAPAP